MADIRSNAEITYTLFGPGAEKFKLDTGKGEIWAKQIPVSTKSHIQVVLTTDNLKLYFVLVNFTSTTKMASFRKVSNN